MGLRISQKLRQSTKRRLSFLAFNDKPKSKKQASQLRIWLSQRTCVRVIPRTAATTKKKHTKKLNGRVVRLPFGQYREIRFERKTYKTNQWSFRQLLRVERSKLSYALAAAGIAGIIVFGTQVVRSSEEFYVPNTVSVQVATPPDAASTTEQVGDVATSDDQVGDDQQLLAPSTPTRIVADDIALDATIVTVGLLEDNTMETPPLTGDDAGWYTLGPTPGELGPAIINGHVGTKRGPSVFWDLHRLVPGSTVEIERADGSIVAFRVTGIDQYDINSFPTETVYGNIDHAGLRLITCGGTFDEGTQRYSHNTVVYAEMITTDTALLN